MDETQEHPEDPEEYAGTTSEKYKDIIKQYGLAPEQCRSITPKEYKDIIGGVAPKRHKSSKKFKKTIQEAVNELRKKANFSSSSEGVSDGKASIQTEDLEEVFDEKSVQTEALEEVSDEKYIQAEALDVWTIVAKWAEEKLQKIDTQAFHDSAIKALGEMLKPIRHDYDFSRLIKEYIQNHQINNLAPESPEIAQILALIDFPKKELEKAIASHDIKQIESLLQKNYIKGLFRGNQRLEIIELARSAVNNCKNGPERKNATLIKRMIENIYNEIEPEHSLTGSSESTQQIDTAANDELAENIDQADESTYGENHDQEDEKELQSDAPSLGFPSEQQNSISKPALMESKVIALQQQQRSLSTEDKEILKISDNEEEITPAEAIEEAILEGNNEKLETLLTQNPEMFKQHKGFLEFALSAKIKKGTNEIIKTLLSHGADPNEQINTKTGETALHIALRKTNTSDKTIELLLKSALRKSTGLTTCDESGSYPIHTLIAAPKWRKIKKFKAFLSFLINKKPEKLALILEQKNKDGKTALDLALGLQSGNPNDEAMNYIVQQLSSLLQSKLKAAAIYCTIIHKRDDDHDAANSALALLTKKIGDPKQLISITLLKKPAFKYYGLHSLNHNYGASASAA